MRNTKVLIIGYGSPIRGDDAIGPLVADRLAEAGVLEGVTVLSRHILTAELVADLAAHDRVIFLDASVEGTPGEVRCRRLDPDADAISTMAHFHDPRELLAWCETLHGHAPEAYLVSACGASFDYADYRLTPTAEAAIAPMMGWVARLAGLDGNEVGVDGLPGDARHASTAPCRDDRTPHASS